MNNNYQCPKCGCNECEASEISTTGGFFSKIFDVQSNKFTAITCKSCKYTELYKGTTSMLGNIFDFFTN